METAIAITSIAALVGVMVLMGKVRRMRKDIKQLKDIQPYRTYLNGHSSATDWERAAHHSDKASRERRGI